MEKSVRSGSALYFNNRSILGRAIIEPIALCKMVLPLLSMAFGFAPCFNKNSAVFFRPASIAAIKGVSPFNVVKSIFEVLFIMISNMGNFACRVARKIGERLPSFVSNILAFMAIRVCVNWGSFFKIAEDRGLLPFLPKAGRFISAPAVKSKSAIAVWESSIARWKAVWSWRA